MFSSSTLDEFVFRQVYVQFIYVCGARGGGLHSITQMLSKQRKRAPAEITLLSSWIAIARK